MGDRSGADVVKMRRKLRQAAYIRGLQKNASVLGTEYDYVNGGALLRVAEALKPSTANAYAAAFGGELYKS